MREQWIPLSWKQGWQLNWLIHLQSPGQIVSVVISWFFTIQWGTVSLLVAEHVEKMELSFSSGLFWISGINLCYFLCLFFTLKIHWKNYLYCIFFTLPFSPFYPLPQQSPCHVHEFFFLFSQSFHALTHHPTPTSCHLLSISESVPIVLVSSVCSLDST